MSRETVIVGGGIMGVCTAYYLMISQDAPKNVTLVEDAFIAAGASGKAGGFLAFDWIDQPSASLANLSSTLFRQLNQEFNGEDGENKWGFRGITTYGTTVSSTFHSSQTQNQTKGTWGQSEDDVESGNVVFSSVRPTPVTQVLSKQDAEPWLDGSSIQTVSILGKQNTTFQVDPLSFTRDLFRDSRRKGLKYIKGSPVSLSRDSSNGNITSITVQRSNTPLSNEGDTEEQDTLFIPDNPIDESTRILPCTQLLIACGPWTSQVLQKLQLSSPHFTLTAPLFDLPGHSLILKPLLETALPPTAVYFSVTDHDGSNQTTHPETFNRPDGTVYLAGANGGVSLPSSCSSTSQMHDEKRFSELLKAAKLLSSHLDVEGGKAVIVKKQLCYRPMTKDGHTIIDRVEDDVWVLAGAGPWGITLGPACGKVMAELMTNGKAESAHVEGLEVDRLTKKA